MMAGERREVRVDKPWGMLRGVTRGVDAPTSVKPGTIPRIWGFARPYRGQLRIFLLLTVVMATIGVLTRCSPAGW
jgi:hypothetical protein